MGTSASTRTTPADITAAVLASFEQCADPRLRTLMQAFVRHLHEFAVEVGLTEEEWRRLMGVLTDTGHITDDRRQEFILWSDTLGLSMLVDALAHELPAGATESTVLGPFYLAGSPPREYGESMVREECAGVPALVYGRVLDVDGSPIAGAELDVWQNGADMLYAVQRPEAPEDHLRGRYHAREDGSYAFLAVRPVPYPIPDDGPVGRMLKETGRHPWAPRAHPHDHPGAWLQDRHDAHLRRGQRVPRLGHRVRGQAVAAAHVPRALGRRPPAPEGHRGRMGLARERHRACARGGRRRDRRSRTYRLSPCRPRSAGVGCRNDVPPEPLSPEVCRCRQHPRETARPPLRPDNPPSI
jgi:hydroxyquinol 1,2-dioxygenase